MTTTMEPVVTGVGISTPWSDDPRVAGSLAGRAAPADDTWFDTAAQLGRRGYRYLPPACRYLLAAARRADAAGGLAGVPEPARGAVVGTNGAAAAVLAGMDGTVLGHGADELSPALAPFFAINVYAARLSTEHAIKGFATTLTTPVCAGLEAVGLAVRSLRLGRAEAVLAAATEAAPAPDEDQPDRALAEAGAVVLVLEDRAAAQRRGAVVHGRLRVRSGPEPTDPAGRASLARLASELLEPAGPDPDRREAPPAGPDPDRREIQLVGPDGARTDAVHTVLSGLGRTTRIPAGSGCLAALLAAAGGLAGGAPPRLVAAVPPDGPVTLLGVA